MMTPSETSMHFWDHVAELRKRLFVSLGSIGVGFLVGFWFSKPIFQWLRIPYDRAYQDVFGQFPQLITTGILEAFMVYVKVGVLAGFFLASPVVFYQLWKFVSPGLKGREKKLVLPLVGVSSFLFLGGALFGYFAVFPKCFSFFLSLLQGENIQSMVRMEEYYSFAWWMLLGFGVSFQLPLLFLLLVGIGVLSPKQLLTHWRGITMGLGVLSAVITPTPDMGTMLMMLVPLMGLYGVTILISFLLFPKKN